VLRFCLSFQIATAGMGAFHFAGEFPDLQTKRGRGKDRDPAGAILSANQKLNWSMFSAVNTEGGPKITTPSFPIVRLPSLPAENVSPSFPSILPEASWAAA
jgi:hypothetical protein